MSEIKEMTIEELEARSAEIVTEVENAETTEERLKELDVESALIEERKNELRKAAAEAQETRDMVAEDKVTVEEIKEVITEERKMTNFEMVKTAEYRDAFKQYILTGKDEECRALLTENVASGTVPVPEIVYDIVKNAWQKEGIMSRVRKAYIRGNLKVGFEISSTGATVHTEGDDAVSEETLVLGTVALIPASIKKWISISDEAMDLRGEAFLRYIYDELAYQIAKKAADELVAKIVACGTVSTTTCPSVPVIATTATLSTIASAMGMLSDQAANPVIIMNKATWAEFVKLQASGNYGFDPFMGLDVVFNNSITSYTAATTGVTYAIVGDLGEGALANFPNGEEITFKFDDLSLAAKDLVKVTGREFVALGVIAPDHFVKITK